METQKGTLKTCSRGHEFYRSSDCPTCPKCWPGYYKKLKSDFPKLSAPALRALHNAHIPSLSELAKHTEKEVLALHGMGPGSFPILRDALQEKGLDFRKEE
jgi:hypothetical protein